MDEFEQWAVDVGYAIGMHLGASNVGEEIAADHARWTFRGKTVTARRRSPGELTIDLVYVVAATGATHAAITYLRTSPKLAGAQIAGALAAT